MDYSSIIQILDSALRLMTPLLLACLAGLYSERSGVFDIGLEGKMLMAAFTAASVAYATGNAWLGLLAGIGGSLALSLVHGLASITFRGNQLISGVAINFLASGLTVLLGQKIFSLGGRTPALDGGGRFGEIRLPFADALRDVPFIGRLYADVLSGHTILVYVAFLCVPLTWWVLYRTRFGLRLRAVGENPASVDTAGVSVVRLRYAAIAICGILCGLAGAYLAIGLSAGFVKEMTAGRGFIALAALIFAKWRPWYALGTTFLFGLMEAIANYYPNLSMPIWIIILVLVAALIVNIAMNRDKPPSRLMIGGVAVAVIGLLLRGYSRMEGDLLADTITIPSMFMSALPYILTVIILAGFVGRAIPPRAGGEPYVKER